MIMVLDAVHDGLVSWGGGSMDLDEMGCGDGMGVVDRWI